jgi:uncharacterized alpha/beta hydrolase family protein
MPYNILIKKINTGNLILKQYDKTDLVILLHGINKSGSCLNSLENFIKINGFSVLNITYPSTKYPIEELVDILHKLINSEFYNYKTISFVGFSMGGLVIRAYLNKYKLLKLGKVVMVGTPNNGSEVADFFKDNKLYKKLFGPAGRQLTTDKQNHETLFGKINYECGIIAGDLPLDFCYPLMKGGISDGKVKVTSTKLDNMKDHIVINVTHWYMPKSKQVWKQIVYFLKHSKFLKA